MRILFDGHYKLPHRNGYWCSTARSFQNTSKYARCYGYEELSGSVQTPGSRLAVSLSPFGEFSARYTPTGANFESRQFFAVDHSQYGVGRQIQQFSGLAWTQE